MPDETLILSTLITGSFLQPHATIRSDGALIVCAMGDDGAAIAEAPPFPPLVTPAPALTFAPIQFPLYIGPSVPTPDAPGNIPVNAIMDTSTIDAWEAAHPSEWITDAGLLIVYSDRAIYLDEAIVYATRLHLRVLANDDSGADTYDDAQLAKLRPWDIPCVEFYVHLDEFTDPQGPNRAGARNFDRWGNLLGRWPGQVGIIPQAYVMGLLPGRTDAGTGQAAEARASIVAGLLTLVPTAINRAGGRCAVCWPFRWDRKDGCVAFQVLADAVRGLCAAAPAGLPVFMAPEIPSPAPIIQPTISGGLMLAPGIYSIGIVGGQVSITPAVAPSGGGSPITQPAPAAPADYAAFNAALESVAAHRRANGQTVTVGLAGIDAWRLLIEHPMDVDYVKAQIT
jgi:hypothetical protein